MKKRISLVILALALCLSLFGCGGSASASASSSTPEEYLTGIVSDLLQSRDYGKYWDENISQTSLDANYAVRDLYIASAKQLLADGNQNIKVTGVEPIGNETITEEISYAAARINYEASGTKKTFDLYEYIIVEDGKYKLLPGGITEGSVYNFDHSDQNTFHINAAKIGRSVDDSYHIILELDNGTNDEYSTSGYGSKLMLVTDQGEYIGDVTPLGEVQPHTTMLVESANKGATGEPTKLILKEVCHERETLMPESIEVSVDLY